MKELQETEGVTSENQEGKKDSGRWRCGGRCLLGSLLFCLIKNTASSPCCLYYHRCKWFGVTRGGGSINTQHPHRRPQPNRQTFPHPFPALHPSVHPSICSTARLDLPQLRDGQMFCSSKARHTLALIARSASSSSSSSSMRAWNGREKNRTVQVPSSRAAGAPPPLRS